MLHFFVPRLKRAAVLSVMALHTELHFIPQKAPDATMRLIRLQWWRDEIEKIKNKQNHADSSILDEISSTIQNFDGFGEYLNRFDKNIRGEAADIEEALYKIFGDIINNEKHIERFSKKLALHDELEENTAFRPFRLWLGK